MDLLILFDFTNIRYIYTYIYIMMMMEVGEGDVNIATSIHGKLHLNLHLPTKLASSGLPTSTYR